MRRPTRSVVKSTGYPYDETVAIDFDPAKDAANRAKHGLSLADGEAIFADPDPIVLPTIRREDEERRFKVVGTVAGRLRTGVFVWRGTVVRFISVRRSNAKEARAHSG